MINCFVTSDSHFSHWNQRSGGIIKLVGRVNPETGLIFSSIVEMDNLLIKLWNSVVSKNDFVIHCGDFALCSQIRFDEIIHQLNGRKILVLGNHDNRSWRFYLDNDRFNMVVKQFSWKGILFSHRPIDNFVGQEKLIVHGHTHKEINKPRHKNACVELTNYTPISLDEILKGMA